MQLGPLQVAPSQQKEASSHQTELEKRLYWLLTTASLRRDDDPNCPHAVWAGGRRKAGGGSEGGEEKNIKLHTQESSETSMQKYVSLNI